MKLTFLKNDKETEYNHLQYRSTPFKASEIFQSDIQAAQKLTQHKDSKTVYRLTLNTTAVNHEFLPGDTIGILPSNNKTLVDKLLVRLNLEAVADTPCHLESPAKHLPPHSTLRNIFFNHVDIHTPPKKIFLKALQSHVKDDTELKQLQQICSQQNYSKEYIEFIGGCGRSLLGLLDTFSSCQPPVELILKHLPPLQPRPYSISSSPLNNSCLDITFFILLRQGGKGVCTGWLEDAIADNTPLYFYFRQPTSFRLPQNLSVPLILIATGTGIAPFQSLLQHIHLQHKTTNIWLFYGCCFIIDCLYKNEINDYLKSGVLTKVDYAFSREQNEKVYVQHCIDKYGDEFVNWILQKGARVFVCGDAKTMVKCVKEAIVNNLCRFGAFSHDEAVEFLKEMQNNEKFVVDTWT